MEVHIFFATFVSKTYSVNIMTLLTGRLKALRFVLIVSATWCALSLYAQGDGRVFSVFNASNGLADNSAQTIHCTKTGRMVISTIGHVNFYDGSEFSHVDPTKDVIYKLAKYTGHYHLYFDRSHHIWLKDKYQVTCVDLLTERFIPDIAGLLREIGINRHIDDLFVEDSGPMWFVIGDSLHCPQRNMRVKIRQDAILQDISVYNEHQLLLFFNNGIVDGFDVPSGKPLFQTEGFTGEDSEKYGQTSVICQYQKSYYQICNGVKEALLHRFDVDTRKWTVIMATPYHLNNMAVDEGQLYIASEYGYWIYDIHSGRTNHVAKIVLKGGRLLETDVNTLAFDRQGGMWVGTERRGLLYARPYASSFTVYDWSQQQARDYAVQLDAVEPLQTTDLPRRTNCRYRDSRGWVWTGTFTGLALQTSENAAVRMITKADGLSNEVIHSLVEDDQHNIWASTSYGIVRLTIEGDKIVHVQSYNEVDDVPNESFVNGRAMKLSDGTIVMQALDHVVAFNPANFHDRQIRDFRLFPKLIRLMVNGQNILPGMEVDGRVILDRAITRTREIVLNYNQNSIMLTFSGLNYYRPIQTFYRYRIVNYQDNWRVMNYHNSNGLVDSRGMFHLPLVGIRPGKYYIELQASMQEDTWINEPYQWELEIKEPWWRSTGMYIVLSLILLALLVGNFIMFNRNFRLRIMRNNEEGDIVKRIKTFAERCEGYSGEVLTPYYASMDSGAGETQATLSPEFIEAMLKIVPVVRESPQRRFSLGELASVAGYDLGKLNELLSANLYKSPRMLAYMLRLQNAADMLLNTDKTIEDIADECGFVSPNFFIASFYHRYRVTPADYRKSSER